MTIAYPEWICGDCGDKHGQRPLGKHGATWHDGTCDICGMAGWVTEPRDFGHLKPQPRADFACRARNL